MITAGIDSHIAVRLVKILDKRLYKDLKEDIVQINKYGKELLQKQIKVTGPLMKEEKKKIIALIGPTGVGKTTTIAKIAAKYALIDKKHVSLVTFDTFRIGAMEQLKIYANIIGIPVEVILSPEEFSKILDKKSNADLILIDTAGRNHKDKIYLNQIKDLLTAYNSIDGYLVLSATSSNSILQEIINHFRDIPIKGIIFTKLDEADRFGPIFNAMINAKKPLSYFTTGQRVPEDIELATSERLTGLILGTENIVIN